MDFLLGGVSPRPIALVSTLSGDGIRNLSPFSFFNAFGGNPPTVAFSPSRRQRDNTTKDTYHNLMDTGECVIQTVTHAMVHQVSLASTEYPSEVDEFVKCGLTPVKSDLIKPDRVGESPFQMECRLDQMIHLGDGGGSGNLAICQVVKFHIEEDILENGVIHPDRLDSVGRNSASYYTRASGDAVFEVKKPIGRMGIGYDNLPGAFRSSHVYSANNLAQFANCETIPSNEEMEEFKSTLTEIEASEAIFNRYARLKEYQSMFNVAYQLSKTGHPKSQTFMEKAAKCALECNDTDFAWKAGMAAVVA